jgi:hypothetical protein
MAVNPTLFTDRAEAETEARSRLLSMRAAWAIAGATPTTSVTSARRVVVLDSDGGVLIDAELS